VSATDALAAALPQRILNGEFKSGDSIREVQVAETYGVARHTVRSACILLSNAGLLIRELNRGVFVPELSQKDIEDLFWLRACLEVPSFERLAEMRLPLNEAQQCLR
jgi:DNA-binding GntR family transcriptional regulator